MAYSYFILFKFLSKEPKSYSYLGKADCIVNQCLEHQPKNEWLSKMSSKQELEIIYLGDFTCAIMN